LPAEQGSQEVASVFASDAMILTSWQFTSMQGVTIQRGSTMSEQLLPDAVEHLPRIVTLILGLFFLGGCAEDRPDASKLISRMDPKPLQAEDTATLGWNDKIDSSAFGLAPNALVDGKTLGEIISSQAAARADGLVCSACHNRSEQEGGYQVPVDPNGALQDFNPSALVGSHTWVGTGGWGERFSSNNSKPDNLRIFVQAWIRGDYR
jgi:hypothetical protein